MPQDDSDPRYRPITDEEEAWLQERVNLLNRLAADEEPEDAPVAPAGAAILFLDLDDVMCLAAPFGGHDAFDALTGKRLDVERVYRTLFHAPAVKALRKVHERLGGRLRYVISSTWRTIFNRAQLRHVLREAGLGFVADGLEDRARWATPVLDEHDRHAEIGVWLARYHAGEPFAVIDDSRSGATLDAALADPDRIVICTPEVGLEMQHVAQLARALTTPKTNNEWW